MPLVHSGANGRFARRGSRAGLLALAALVAAICGGLSGCENREILDPFAGEAEDRRSAGGACRSDGDCALPEAYCDDDTGRCVACRRSSDCARGVCDPTTATCVEPCNRNDDCTGHAWLCDGTLGVCVECATDSHCDGEQRFCLAGECVECLTDGDCSSNAGEPFCDPDRGRCRECLTDEHCSSGQCTTRGCESVG